MTKDLKAVEGDSDGRALLLLLWSGWQQAHYLHCPVEKFGWDMEALRHCGIAADAVQAAIAAGHAVWLMPSISSPGDSAAGTPSPLLVLTETGDQLARELALASLGDIARNGKGRGPGRPRRKPLWDSRMGLLCYRGEILLRLKRPHSNLWRLLSAFQEAHWYWRIDNPWPGTDRHRCERLLQTAKDLNRRQRPRRLHFQAEINGEGVRWTVIGMAGEIATEPPR